MKELNYNIEAYYSCEIDKNALLLTNLKFGKNIIQLGSVVDINKKKLDELGNINLLIGGSPSCDITCSTTFRRGLYGNTYLLSGSLSLEYKFPSS